MFPVNHKRHGFTLVELVLTLVILGILAAVALPKFFNRSVFDERYFTDDLTTAVQYAQRLATGSGCSVRLSISVSGFSLEQDINCTISSPSFTLTVPRPNDSEPFSNNDVPDSVTISSTYLAYVFLPTGQIVTAAGVNVGSANITLTGETTRIIFIEGSTGYAYQN